MEKHGLMDHSRTGGRFSTSRDWNMPTVKCAVTGCILIEISADGKCKGRRE
jgi:hypothetical protein